MRRILLALALLCAFAPITAQAQTSIYGVPVAGKTVVDLVSGTTVKAKSYTAVPVLSTKTTTGPGPWVANTISNGFVHIWLSNTTTPTATVTVEVSNDQNGPVTVYTTTLLTSAGAGDGVILVNNAAFLRINVTALSGASAAITATEVGL